LKIDFSIFYFVKIQTFTKLVGFEKILAPSRDPSPPLSFWDKMRLLLHGRLTMVVQQLTVLLHASLDPYNTTEEMELTWNQVVMDWTNGTTPNSVQTRRLNC
jgi:hypothetical protein